MIGLADDAFLFHPFNEGGGAIIAELQSALNIAGRRLAVPDHDLDCLLVEVGALGATHAGRIEYGAVLALHVVLGRHRVQVLRLTLGFEVAHDLFNLIVGHEWTVNAADSSTANHVEHVALTEQLLGQGDMLYMVGGGSWRSPG